MRFDQYISCSSLVQLGEAEISGKMGRRWRQRLSFQNNSEFRGAVVEDPIEIIGRYVFTRHLVERKIKLRMNRY